MPPFLAGPAVNMRTSCREILAKRSRDRPAGDYPQPYRDEPDHDTQDYIQSGYEQFTVLNAAKRFVFECGEGGVGADESDGNQVAPVRAPMSSFGENGDDEANEE